jgi:gamma-glutamyltranspeptidase/glutathione hydrolase
VLRGGGNAVDAATAAAFVQYVVEPHACGVGGDMFTLVHRSGEPLHALDGSGDVPAAMAEHGQDADFPAIPLRGPRTVTVPGAVAGLEHLVRSHGSAPWEDLIAPARRLAVDGFEVRPTLTAAIDRVIEEIADDDVLGPLYVPDGRHREVGETIQNPALGELLGAIAAEGAAVLYRGDVADALVAAVTPLGGYLAVSDLASYSPALVDPVRGEFRGADVWELPAPTQGPAVLHALARLGSSGPVDDQDVMDAVVAGLRLEGIDLLAGASARPTRGDTTYIAVVDGAGMGVSLITSVFADFGSCLGVPVLGGPLHNRGAGISLIGRRPSPGRPPHTTIPALVTRGGDLEMVLGVVGGLMQAQGQVQILVNLLARDMSAVDAVDAPRFRVLMGGDVALEQGHPLAPRHPGSSDLPPGLGGFGGANVVRVTGDGIEAAADHRRGGAATVFEIA